MNHEVLTPPRHLDSLRIVVHPMFLGPNLAPTHDYVDSQTQMGNAMVERFTPQTQNELVLVMPNVSFFSGTYIKNLRGEIRKQRQTKAENPEWQVWTDLYKRLKDASTVPSNVRLMENIGLAYAGEGNLVNERVTQLGFYIDPETEIIIGGQWLDVCVETTFKKLLKLPNVSRVKIDKRSTRESQLQYMHWYSYIPVVQGEPFTWSEDEDYYYISKR